MGLSRDGVLVFTQRLKMVPDRTLTWVDFEGKETPIPVPPGPYLPTDISPDGGTVLVAKYDDFEAQWGLWLMPLGAGEWKRISDGHPYDVAGVFAGDNKTILLNRMGTGLMRRRLDSFASEECIAPEPDFSRYPVPFAPGQKEVLFAEGYRPVITTLFYSLAMGSQPGPPRRLSSGESGARLSPDLNWLAAIRDGKVVVRRYPLSETDTPLRWGKGSAPVWSLDGKTMYFANENREMLAVPFHPGPPARFGSARVLFPAGRYELGNRWYSGYHLRRDGKAFLMARNEAAAPQRLPTTVQVVRNWFTEVQALAHPGSR